MGPWALGPGLCGFHTGSVWMPHKGLLLFHNSTMVSLNSRICRPETPEKHDFGHERGRHATVRADTLGNGSHAPQDAWGPQNAPKRQKIRQKTGETGVLGPGPPSGPATVLRCGVHCSAVYTCACVELLGRCLRVLDFRWPAPRCFDALCILCHDHAKRGQGC